METAFVAALDRSSVVSNSRLLVSFSRDGHRVLEYWRILAMSEESKKSQFKIHATTLSSFTSKVRSLVMKSIGLRSSSQSEE